MKKIRKHIIIAMLVLVFSLPLSLVSKTLFAASYPIPSVSASQLTSHRGNQVTGDDIVNTGAYLAGLNFTYDNVGTCTGFVTRVLVYLKVGLPLVSNNSNWNSFYDDNSWDDKGYGAYPAATGPNGFKTRADNMVSAGTAQYIGVIPVGRQEDNGYINSLGIQNGDLLVTPNTSSRSGHVAFAYIYGGNVKSLGAASGGIAAIDLNAAGDEKLGDIYVYRLVASTGNLRIQKIDDHNKIVAGVTLNVSGPGVNGNYVTDGNGMIQLDNITAGEYTITEVAVPNGMVLNTTPVKVTVSPSQTATVNFNNTYQRGKARIHKIDSKEGENPKGDAKLEGAVYGLFASTDIYEGSTLVYSKDQKVNNSNVTTGQNGYTPYIENIPIGSYYWKELSPSEGYLKNEINVDIKIEYQGPQSYEANLITSIHEEEKMYERARVIKMDNDSGTTDEKIAVGAVLKLTLKSKPEQFYYATIREDGSAEFIDEEFKEKHPDEEYTIPYGTYIISEEKASYAGEHTYFHIQPYELVLHENHKTETVIVLDEPVTPFLRIVKKDAITGKTVELPGAKFKVWDCQNNKFVEQIESPSGAHITEFVANDKGEVTLPQKVQPGKYIIYETAAPEGYLLNPEWALPENEEDYGVEGKGGKLIDLTKETIGISEDEVYDKDAMIIYTEEMPDYPLMVKLTINKTGEMLSEVKTQTVKYKISEKETKSEEKFTPVYTFRGLPGVTYDIVAAENITSPDGNGIYAKEGEVVDTITTGEDGTATTKDIYPGTYKIKEIVTPTGYIKDDNIEDITLTNTDQTIPVKLYEKDLTDVRQKLELSFLKKFVEPEFKISDENVKQNAIFGIYTSQEIYNYTGNVVIPKDSLVDLIEIEGTTDVTSKIDLPEGKYYAKELYVSSPYTPSTEIREFDLKYNGNSTQQLVVVKGDDMINYPEYASLTLIKLSTDIVDQLALIGPNIEMTELSSKAQEIINNVKGMTLEQIEEYLKENEINVIPDATYGIYLDEECSNPLKTKDNKTGEYVDFQIVTNSSGLIIVDNLPLGEYYIKEVSVPEPYKLSDEVIKVELTSGNTMIYQAVIEDEFIEPNLTKTDVFTGEAIPNCVFELRDENGKVILKSITDNNGIGYVPVRLLENGKTYTYTEVEAPDIYNLNAEPHEFVASYEITDDDVIWTGEKLEVENTRKTREVIVRKVDAETGEPLQGCVFTIAMIDPETGEQKVNAKTGEPIYLVENAVTDENGEYVIPEAPMGTYKFTEIKAPEGYEMDEDLTGLVFTIDNNSPETIIFEVTNTGDIAVMVVSAVAILSVCGIAFVMIRNKRKANE